MSSLVCSLINYNHAPTLDSHVNEYSSDVMVVKATTFTFLMRFRRQNGVETVVIRIFFTFNSFRRSVCPSITIRTSSIGTRTKPEAVRMLSNLFPDLHIGKSLSS
jgi:hypothetical protein